MWYSRTLAYSDALFPLLKWKSAAFCLGRSQGRTHADTNARGCINSLHAWSWSGGIKRRTEGPSAVCHRWHSLNFPAWMHVYLDTLCFAKSDKTSLLVFSGFRNLFLIGVGLVCIDSICDMLWINTQSQKSNIIYLLFSLFKQTKLSRQLHACAESQCDTFSVGGNVSYVIRLHFSNNFFQINFYVIL